MIRMSTRTIAVGALAAMTAVGTAGAASADSVAPNGRYNVVGGSDQFYVDITANCATQGCTANLASNRGWTSTATLNNNVWTFNVTKPDGVICADGNYADIVIRYAVDANTLAGFVIADSNGECPGGQITRTPIQLVKLG